jgi:hypothetical protein
LVVIDYVQWGPGATPEELVAGYRRHELDHGRKPKTPLTTKAKAKRERARAKRKRKSK